MNHLNCVYVMWFPDGTGYAGQAENFDVRRDGHRRDANRNVCRFVCRRGLRECVYCAIRRVGYKNIRWEIVDENLSLWRMDKLEINVITFHEFYADPTKGYNLTKGGEGVDSVTAKARYENMTPEEWWAYCARQKAATNTPQARANMQAAQIDRWSKITEEELLLFSENVSMAVKKYFDNLTEEEYEYLC